MVWWGGKRGGLTKELARGAGSQLYCLKFAPHVASFTTAFPPAGPLQWPLASAGRLGFPYSMASGFKLKAVLAFHG